MASVTEDILSVVKTRLELIGTTAGYNYYGALKSVQLVEHKWEGGERPTVNAFAKLPTIIIRDLGDSATADTDSTWERRITIECWFATDDGSLVSLIRAYDDMMKALDPAALTQIREPRYSRAYTDQVTQQALDGVLLLIEGTYTVSMSDPSSGV